MQSIKSDFLWAGIYIAQMKYQWDRCEKQRVSEII